MLDNCIRLSCLTYGMCLRHCCTERCSLILVAFSFFFFFSCVVLLCAGEGMAFRVMGEVQVRVVVDH